MTIRVSASVHVAQLARRIVEAVDEGCDVDLRAIGPFPVAAAVKAVCIANGTFGGRGSLLGLLPGMAQQAIEDKATGGTTFWVVTSLRVMEIR